MNSYSYLPAPTFVDEPNPTASDEPTAATTPLGPPVEGTLGPRQPAKGRHERKCCICHHPDRDAIEEAFLHWQSPNEIATHYELPDLRPLYRHAHATGLYALRKRHLRFVLDNLLERVCEIEVITPSSILRAVRAYTRITDDGEWIEPPERIIVTHVRSEDTFAPDPPQAGEGHIRAPEDTFTPLAPTRSGGDPPHAGEGHAKAEDTDPPSEALPSLPQTKPGGMPECPKLPCFRMSRAKPRGEAPRLPGRRTGPQPPRRKTRRKGPNKLNANRQSSKLAKVSNH